MTKRNGTTTIFWCSFDILAEVEDDHVFRSASSKVKQAPVAYQLLVFFAFLGMEGDGSSNAKLRNLLRPLGRGTLFPQYFDCQ
jgi:hypothetical protein